MIKFDGRYLPKCAPPPNWDIAACEEFFKLIIMASGLLLITCYYFSSR
ncbi:hypothetical protein GECvBN5_gp008c [Salmonella phage GEC_vB_N5]|uniref:Uncharacterized protein n=2 Tax=Markadamsvirinae TaxID=2732013 RepID=A0A7S9SRB0_9CAUD|nr:hypothetical protein GECvBN3_gp008c [Salmonella phage GEC_vB_N3]QPI15024.1 hypothetical protein GECvBN5_gp008c [Salmonella phage GEC_vB_N5]